MGLVEILGILSGIFKFWPSVVEMVKMLQKTPAEKHAALISAIREASDRANRTKGDTSGYEAILRG